MESLKDGGGVFDAPPPMSGLGNFKGVMLCNRPSDESMKVKGNDGAGPFKSMISATCGEQLGLTPARNFEPTVKKRGPSAALRRHVRWLRELQEQMRDEREQVEQEGRGAEEKKQRTKAASDKHRNAVRRMMQERDTALILTERTARAFMAPPAKEAHNEGRKQAPATKPLWAMTPQEQDEFEDEDADNLISFAEGLDFDKYVGDLEFRQGMEALKDRAGKLQKAQDAFKDALIRDFNSKAVEDDDEARSTSAGSGGLEDGLDGHSLLGDLCSEYSTSSSRRRRREDCTNGDGRPEWDSSTVCGEDRPEEDRTVKATAEAVLESAPQIRAIHSKESIQRIIEKARQKQTEEVPPDLIQKMRQDGPVPAPVIVASSDTQNRLFKPVDPSQLPYLYRSPAI